MAQTATNLLQTLYDFNNNGRLLKNLNIPSGCICIEQAMHALCNIRGRKSLCQTLQSNI